MKDWCAAGPAHHCAIGFGHLATKLEKLAQILKIECTLVG
jgi:L-arabinose isomerase